MIYLDTLPLSAGTAAEGILMPISQNDLLLLTFRGTLFGQRVMTQYGFVCTSSSSANDVLADQQQLADNVSTDTGTQILGTYLACLSPALVVNQIWVQRIWPTRQIRTIKTVNLAGQRGINTDTANVAAVITRRTNLSGRDQISNLHLPGPPMDADLVAGVWQAGVLGAYGAHAAESYDSITVPVTGGSYTVRGCIIHRTGAPGAHTLITSHLVNQFARTMRRRTVGLGE